MKTLSIGDIHGQDTWKVILFGSANNYSIWRTAHVAGAPVDWDSDLPFLKYDQIIFIGDYVDSFTISSPEILENLREIIDLKKILEYRVVLLLGNHDVQYFVKGQCCSGYRAEMQHDLEQLFSINADLFQMAHSHGTWLWTHAGVSSRWLKELHKELYNPTMRFSKILKEERPTGIADEVNLAFKFRLKSIFYVDWDSGGPDSTAGPLWIRPSRLNRESIPGLNQVVGHTAKREIERFELEDHCHCFIDVLQHQERALELTLE